MRGEARSRITPLVENVAEATTACLITMVQGNLLALTLGHWIVASRTGVIAGLVATAALMAARAERRWLVSLALGSITAVVDYFVHPGQFGPAIAEAVVTGAGAGVLSLLVGSLISRVRRPA